MARRDSKSWRRSRTLSTAFLDDALRDNKTCVASSHRSRSTTYRRARRADQCAGRPIARLRLRPSFALPATALALCIVFLLVGRSNHPPDPALSRSSLAGLAELGEHPNFDFDAHLEPVKHRAELEEEEEVQVAEEGGEEALADAEGVKNDDVDDVETATDLEDERESVGSARTQSNSLVKPFLPLTCEPCSPTLVTSASSSSICAKYRPPPSAASSPLHPDILDHSILFAGTGTEVRRVLKRAMRSALYGLKRHKEGSEGEVQKFEGEEPFRILVLGGSGAFRPLFLPATHANDSEDSLELPRRRPEDRVLARSCLAVVPADVPDGGRPRPCTQLAFSALSPFLSSSTT